MTSLGQGDYQIIIDFANAALRNTNIQGSVALLDEDGGNYRESVRFNELGVSYRKIGTFLLRNDGPRHPQGAEHARHRAIYAEGRSSRSSVTPRFPTPSDRLADAQNARHLVCYAVPGGTLRAATCRQDARRVSSSMSKGDTRRCIVSPSRESILVDAGYPGFEGRDAGRIVAAVKNAGSHGSTIWW